MQDTTIILQLCQEAPDRVTTHLAGSLAQNKTEIRGTQEDEDNCAQGAD
jgi:hypothetical protein